MFTERENFLRTINKNHPDRLCNDYSMFFFHPDPIFWLDREGVIPMQKRGDYYKDTWGTTIVYPEDHPGPMPIVTNENKVITDIQKWKEQLVVPDYSKYDLDWTEINEAFEKCDKTSQLTAIIMIVGLFERTHYLMGFEDALINHLLYPEEMHALLDTLLESRLQQAKIIIDNCHPEAIDHHDDWGSKSQLFLPPDVWREFYKERYRELYGYIESRGVLVFHHGDSFQEPIAKDMEDIGLKIWQGAIPENDIVKIQKECPNLFLMGGIDASKVDKKDWVESEIRAEVRRACETYGPQGNFLPSVTYGGPGCLYEGVDDIIRDEIRCYNIDTYGSAPEIKDAIAIYDV